MPFYILRRAKDRNFCDTAVGITRDSRFVFLTGERKWRMDFSGARIPQRLFFIFVIYGDFPPKKLDISSDMLDFYSENYKFLLTNLPAAVKMTMII